MKKIICIFLCMALLTACTKADPADQVKLNIEEVAYQLTEEAEFDITYDADSSFLKNSFEFEESSVSSYKVLFGTMMDANRLAIFEVKDKTERKAALEVAKKIKESTADSFGEEMEALKKQAEDTQIVEKGNYVLLLSGTNASAGIQLFESLFTGVK